MPDLTQDLRALRFELERRAGAREVVKAALAKHEADAAASKDKAETARKAAEVLQAAIEARRQELRDRVETLITRGLRAVFRRSDMRFFFEAQTRGSAVGILPALRSSFRGKEIDVGIVEGHGGGVADAVSFLLRVVVLSLAPKPKLAPVLVLDEPFRHVSQEYLRGAATLLRELNRTAGIQFVLVTHKPDLLDAADVVYRTAVDENGATRFELEHDLRDDVYHQRAAAGARREPEEATVPILVNGVRGELVVAPPLEVTPPEVAEKNRRNLASARQRRKDKARERARGIDGDEF